MVKKNECDKLPNNNIVKNDIEVEQSMTKTTYQQQTEIKKGGMKVIIECPDYSDEDDKIKDEVRLILVNALQEHLKKIS